MEREENEGAAANFGSHVLTINGGSSSIRFALFKSDDSLERVLWGQIVNIGLPNGSFVVQGAKSISRPLQTESHMAAVNDLIDWLENQIDRDELIAVGHRVVHGGAKYSAPERITREVIDYLRTLSPFDPEHLPEEIALVEAIFRRFPDLPQIACFDTAFHHDLPKVAQLLPIPRRYFEQGVRRYGFHGLSYGSLMEQLGDRGRVILAHLGNGASLAAVRDRKPVDTSMAFPGGRVPDEHALGRPRSRPGLVSGGH
ncbi:MAG: hypothetical protein ACREIF_11605 [Chthoniobacterales bacterium]